MFDNYVFDSWLNKKSDEILSKVDKSTISTEEMLTLILKAQTNHFHHMDVEFREEFKRIDDRFEQVDDRFEAMNLKMDARFEAINSKMETRFESVDLKFQAVNTKIDDKFKWQIGIIITLFAGLYLKIFLG